jgi:hypothetical protein
VRHKIEVDLPYLRGQRFVSNLTLGRRPTAACGASRQLANLRLLSSKARLVCLLAKRQADKARCEQALYPPNVKGSAAFQKPSLEFYARVQSAADRAKPGQWRPAKIIGCDMAATRTLLAGTVLLLEDRCGFRPAD